MKRLTAQAIFRSAGFYPVTGIYLAGVIIISLIARGSVTVPYGILILSVAAVFALMLAAYRELRAVHKMIDGQRDELLARIDELTSILVAHGVLPPPSGEKEQDARDDIQRGKGRA